MNIEKQVKEVFADLFEMDEEEVHNTDTMEDIDDWDSLMHIQLMLALEKEFSIKFSTQQIMEMKSVANIIQIISSKF